MNSERTRSRTLRVCGLLAIGVVIFALGASPSSAKTYAISKSPYWKVGAMNEALSKACRRGLFNQSSAHDYNILFVGPDGRTITGIAKKGWNLFDPKGLAKKDVTFHFYNDGYSDCRVYVAR